MRAALVIISVAALTSSQIHVAAAQDHDAACDPCLTCLECSKCKAPCETVCASPLCTGCNEVQDDGTTCFTGGDGSNFCQWNCGPECSMCSKCEQCAQDCAPCNSTLCHSDECSMKTLIHNACDNGNQCTPDSECMKLCDPCLHCSRCAECRATCGSCDDCWNNPGSAACQYDFCDKCKRCKPCDICAFTDDSPCKPCSICVTASNNAMQAQSYDTVPGSAEKVQAFAASSMEGKQGTKTYQTVFACIAAIAAVIAIMHAGLSRMGTKNSALPKFSKPAVNAVVETEMHAMVPKTAAYGTSSEPFVKA